MEWADIMSAIGSVGFPIVMCIYLMKTTNEQLKANTSAIAELNAAVQRLVDKLAD